MRVFINEKPHEYHSDYPDGWKFISGDYFKYPVQIGQHRCFIKRFETKAPTDLPGWDLLVRLKHKNEKNLPRVHDIISVEEKRKQIHYVFYEYVQGITLDGLMEAETPVDLKRLTVDLFNGLDSVHKYEYWFADFCEKNIFREEKGKFLLLDLDSCQPAARVPDNGMKVSMVYWAPVFDFYKKVLNIGELRLSDIPGIYLNHLQIIFLILHLKIFSLNKRYDYMTSESFKELPTSLDRVDPAFRELFVQVLHAARGSGDAYSVEDIRALIFEKIIPLNEWPPHMESPEIVSFESSASAVTKGERFVLSWEINNATHVRLFKNDAEFQRLDASENSFSIKENYDGRDREIAYTLAACNDSGEVRSAPVMVSIKEHTRPKAAEEPTVVPVDDFASDVPVVPLRPTPPAPPIPPIPKPKLSQIRLALTGLTLAVLVGAGVILYNMFRETKAVIADFAPREVVEEHTIVLSGANFPADSNKVHVLFNNVRGKVHFASENTIRVSVPLLGDQKGNGSVKLAVVVGKDTSFAPADLLVKTTVLPPVIVEANEEPVAEEDSQIIEVVSPKQQRVAKKPEVIDSQRVVVIPEPVTKPAEPKKKVNIYELVSVAGNNDYKRKFLGGIKHLKVTVDNKSPYILDNVVVEIGVLKKNDRQIEREFMSFENVRPNASLTRDAPHFSRGAKISLKITSITSKELVNLQGSGY